MLTYQLLPAECLRTVSVLVSSAFNQLPHRHSCWHGASLMKGEKMSVSWWWNGIAPVSRGDETVPLCLLTAWKGWFSNLFHCLWSVNLWFSILCLWSVNLWFSNLLLSFTIFEQKWVMNMRTLSRMAIKVQGFLALKYPGFIICWINSLLKKTW